MSRPKRSRARQEEELDVAATWASGDDRYEGNNCAIYMAYTDNVRVDYEVTIKEVEARPTAVVGAATTWQEFGALWGQLLGEVWACLRANGISRGCRNIMLYWDDVPNVEVGVLLDQPCPLTGRVVASALPAGIAAMTVHRGPFGEVGSAHVAVLEWCTHHGRRTTGTRWEVYGPHSDDPAEQWTEVYWLLA